MTSTQLATWLLGQQRPGDVDRARPGGLGEVEATKEGKEARGPRKAGECGAARSKARAVEERAGGRARETTSPASHGFQSSCPD